MVHRVQYAGPSYHDAVLADNPIAYWRLSDLSAALLFDSSGHAHNGTYSGSPSYGQKGALARDTTTAVLFPNNGDQASVPSGVTISAPYTVEFFSKCSALIGDSPLYMVGLGTGLGVTHPDFSMNHTSKQPIILLANSNYQYFNALGSGIDVGDGNYHHCVFEVTGNGQNDILNSICYVDGNLLAAATNNTGTVPNTPTGQAYIGNADVNARTMDEVALYSGLLSAARVAAHYNASRN